MKRLIAWLAFLVVLSIGGTAQAVWFGQDIGQPGNPAFTQPFEEPAPGTFIVYGGGDDIYGNEDEFHFVYDDVSLAGDAVIQARITALDITNTWSKAGVMIRDELTDVSVNAAAVISGDPRMSFQYRDVNPGGTTHITTGGPPVGDKPYWVRMTRFGDTLTGYRSPDGLNWTAQGSIDIQMISPYIGLAVTSHNNNELAQATFDNVSTARAATEYTWLGGSGNWNTSNKWNPAGVPDGSSKVLINSGTVSVAGDEAAFTLDMRGGSVSVGPGSSLDIVGNLYAAGRTITMGNDSELSFEYGGGTLGTLTFSGTPAVLPSGTLSIDNLRTTSSGAAFAIEGGGTIDVGSVSVRPDTVFNVNAGKLILGGANPLGGSTQDVMLGGGTIALRGREALTDNLVRYGFYDNVPNSELKPIDDGAINGQNGGVWALTPDTARGWTDEVWQQNAFADTYIQMWSGFFTAPETGNYEFYVHGDDHEVFFMDKNQNGEFDGVEELVTDNAPPDGWNTAKTGFIDLVAGESYEFALAQHEQGGGDFVHFEIGLPSAGGRQRINPSLPSQDGWWSAPGVQAVNLPNTDFVVTEDSGIEVISDADGTFGTLTLRNGIITTTGQPMSFAATVVAPDATAVGVDIRAETDFNSIDGSAATGPFLFSKDGPLALTVEPGFLKNMQKATLDARGGTLALNGEDAWAGATKASISGGMLEIRAGEIAGAGLTAGLVGAWLFDEGAGNIAIDSMGNGDGTITGAAWVDDPQRGSVLDFQDADSVFVPAGPFATINEAVTVALWINGDAAIQPQNDFTFVAMIGGARAFGTHMPWSNSQIYWDAGGAQSCCADRSAFTVPAADFEGQWNHYAFTKDINTGEMKVFINGAERHNAGGRTIPLANIDRMYIGSNWNNGEHYDGMVDEFLLYDRALNAAEVSQLFTEGLEIRDLPAVDMLDKEIFVFESGTLKASPSPLNLGTLTISDGATLTTAGAKISFTQIAFEGDGEAAVGFTSNTDTTLTGTNPINGGGRELTFEIDGSARTIVDKVGVGLENTIFELYGGELVGLIDADGTTFGDATLSFNGGGVLLSSTGGNQTYNEPMALEGSGTFTVGEVPGGVSDVEITYGSETIGATLDSFGVLGFEADDGYTLQIDGPVGGVGGIAGDGGIVNLNNVGAKDYAGGTIANEGTLNVNTPLANTSHIEVGEATMVLNADVTTNGGQQVGLMGSIFTGIPRDASHLTLDGAAYFGSGMRVFSGDKAGTVLTDPAQHSTSITGTTQNWTSFPTFGGNMEDFVTAFSGRFIAPETGTYNWHWNNDDRGLMYIDLDDNGIFESTESVAAYAWNSNGNVDMTAGQGYNLIYMAQEFGGGQNVNWYYTPPGGTEVRVDPSQPDQSNLWVSPVSSTTSINEGTLEINAALDTGTVSVGNGGTLNVNDGGSLAATGISISGNGEVNLNGGGSITAETLSIIGGGVYDTQTPSTFRTVSMRGGGTMLTNGNRVTVSESLDAGNYSITVDPGGDFSVMGADLAAGIDALTLGGNVTYNGPRAPISYWTFDDGAGDIAVNSADPTLNGTLIDLGTGTLPAWTSRGKIDGAIVFDGLGYVDLPDGYADFTSGVTVAGWIYHLSFPNWGRIIDFGNGAGVDNILLAHRGTSSDGRFEFHDSPGGTEAIDPNGVFTTFGWQHIVATCDDGPTNGATMKLYVNGDLAFEQGGKSTPANILRTNNYIGESNWDGDDFFHGYMDELIIWDRALSDQEVGALHIAGVLGDPAPDFTQVSLGGTLDGTGTLNSDLTLNGQIIPSGPDGGGSGTINFRGEIRMTEETSTILTMDPAGVSQLANTGNSDLVIGGELQYRVEGVNAADEGKDVSVAIVNAVAEGVIQGEFDIVPPGSAAAPAHVDQGVFHKGLTYGPAFPPTDPPSYFNVDAAFYVAGGGDANGDGRVDGQDITNLITNFSRPGDPADRTWLQSDTAGGIFGRGDGNVDGQDITDLISNFTGDAGPAADGTAAAEYNPATGEVRIFADGVMSWSLISDGDFTGAGLAALSDVLPLGDPANLASLNENTVGEGGFHGTMSYGNVALGAIVPAGTNPSQLTLEYVTGFGAEPQIGTINVVPEPSTVALLAFGLLGVAAGLWRRRRTD